MERIVNYVAPWRHDQEKKADIKGKLEKAGEIYIMIMDKIVYHILTLALIINTFLAYFEFKPFVITMAIAAVLLAIDYVIRKEPFFDDDFDEEDDYYED